MSGEYATLLLGALIGAFVSGSLYALISMGLSLIWSTLGLANFAHGSVLVLGAYVAVLLSVEAGSVYAIVLSIPILFIFGVICNFAMFKRIIGREDAGLRLVLITLALGAMLEQLLNLAFGGGYESIPSFVAGSIQVGPLLVFNEYVFVFVVASSSLAVLYLFLTKTVLGLAIRALGQNITESLVMGINVGRVYSITVGIGFVLACLAGILLGSMYPFNAVSGREPLFIAFVIVVLGGLGNIKGTFYASYIVAAVESLTSAFVGGSWRVAVPFALMILILLMRPRGLFGIREELM